MEGEEAAEGLGVGRVGLGREGAADGARSSEKFGSCSEKPTKSMCFVMRIVCTIPERARLRSLKSFICDRVSTMSSGLRTSPCSFSMKRSDAWLWYGSTVYVVCAASHAFSNSPS